MPEIVETPEFKEALKLIEKRTPFIFITGRAGTGKSTFIDLLRRELTRNFAVVAPTGVAALNVGGQTIHSFFRFPPRPVDPEKITPVRGGEIYRKLELLIIDEISMVRADLLDGIDRFLRINGRQRNKAFGGVQIVGVGDLFQLPPVVSTEEESLYINDKYESPYFFSAECLQQTGISTIEFTRIFRQQDREFIDILNSIRDGSDTEYAIERLNSSCLSGDEFIEGGVTLTCTNYLADKINSFQLKKLEGDVREYNGTVEGDFSLRKERLPAPEKLLLKPGAQVMFTKNDRDKRWVNGTLGIVEELADKWVLVRGMGLSGGVFEVERETWESYRFTYDRESGRIISEVVGRYKQFPLMLAWAVTIHKSQGLTLDKAIIDLGRGAFAAGQTYVALSRCRRLSDITLRRPLTERDLLCDPVIREFYSSVISSA
ncbi:MAG: DNA topoisomerase I [Candidatus Dadabacteria bacterium]|nr:MAG: DNA topoisomerase I [Candidatus Dadabacteria bacterium]